MFMRKFFSLLVASVFGGLIALSSSHLTQSKATINVNSPATVPAQVEAVGKYANYTAGSVAFDFAAAAEVATPAVVFISSLSQEREYGYFGSSQPRIAESTGSGVLLTSEGHIVTNNHVIKGAQEIQITLYDKRKFKAQLVGVDPTTDLAVLKIEAGNLPAIQTANSDDVKVGEWVLAVGNPFELKSTVTAGIVSAKGRDIRLLEGEAPIESFIQTDAAVNPGNSGGALVDVNGRLIGINTAIATPTGIYAGYAFAIPINLVKKVVSDLIQFGKVKRAVLGVVIQDVDDRLAKESRLGVSEGVYVRELSEQGEAAKAGIRPGDVVVKVNNIAVKSSQELLEQIGSKNPGDRVSITINRAGTEKIFSVVLRDRG